MEAQGLFNNTKKSNKKNMEKQPLTVTEIEIEGFKCFKDKMTLKLKDGLSIVAGANNSGKSSLLQAMAVWEFCKTYLLFRHKNHLYDTNEDKQGKGISRSQFLAINIPAMKYLWYNTSPGSSGYSLFLTCRWFYDCLLYTSDAADE